MTLNVTRDNALGLWHLEVSPSLVSVTPWCQEKSFRRPVILHNPHKVQVVLLPWSFA